jgi:DNA-nicking Smr family endonuclease
MSRRRQLSNEERALWRGVARSITPLRDPQEHDPQERDPQGTGEPPTAGRIARVKVVAPPASPSSAPRHQAPPAKTNTPALEPLSRRLKHRVARGREPIDDRLDLHGRTQKEAHAALLRFLRRAQADGAKIVLVVTGKGTGKSARDDDEIMHSPRGVLKQQVPLWLSLPEFRPLIVGFEDAHTFHGGQGALYVRLRRGRASDH